MPPLCGLPLPTSPLRTSRADDQWGATWSKTSDGAKEGREQVVVVGDGACGKTSLLNVFVHGNFPDVYEPTVFENHCVEVAIDDVTVEMSLWDTAGQEDFARLRSLSYSDTHVILLCFSVDQPASLENIEGKWVDEILEYCPGVKLALVALKCVVILVQSPLDRLTTLCDLREDMPTREKLAKFDQAPIEYEELERTKLRSCGNQGLTVARRIRASRYLGEHLELCILASALGALTDRTIPLAECSAKHDRGVRETFEEAARVAVNAQRRGETRGSRADNERGDGNSCRVM
ncbi:SPOSA6832_00221 [Sporobolomyces salmonicolor]|uniref:SPOSA6832_00221-mRNA-1:cds n=1 Tax=Sporidiobolus salmonicolor TaxID=5005 RepID=A0A0D6EFN4_SPOSA|nr:SPOSA6832_00221 [Sporobolomyces salmonicolor]